MFGRFALKGLFSSWGNYCQSVSLALFCVLIFNCQFVLAAQKGVVIAEETSIYAQPDFDAEIIETVKKGEVLTMSTKTKGPFYKVRLQDKRLGWISSIDIKPGVEKVQAQIKQEKKAANKPLDSYSKEKKDENVFAILRYQGPFFQNLSWKEKTLGKTRKDNLGFFGWNWTGFDTLIDGPFYIDSRIMLSFEAPAYYKKVTGFEAKGWILKAQTSFVSANPMGENFLFHYGMGISSTLSNFETSVLEAGNKKNYSMEDVTIGVAIPIGLSYRFGSISTQIFYQFYFEKEQSSGVSWGLNWVY